MQKTSYFNFKVYDLIFFIYKFSNNGKHKLKYKNNIYSLFRIGTST